MAATDHVIGWPQSSHHTDWYQV